MSRTIVNSSFARRVAGSLSLKDLTSSINKNNAAPFALFIAPKRTLQTFASNLDVPSTNYISPLDKKVRQSFVDVVDFEEVAGIYEEADQNREIVIKTSRDIVKGAKKAIYDLHRNQIAEAKRKIQEAESAIETLAPVGKVIGCGIAGSVLNHEGDSMLISIYSIPTSSFYTDSDLLFSPGLPASIGRKHLSRQFGRTDRGKVLLPLSRNWKTIDIS